MTGQDPTAAAGPVGEPVSLPEQVRARVVALTAQVLPSVAPLPPSLRKIAGFAPARRARLGGTQVAAALAADEDLGRRVATRLGAADPALAGLVAGLVAGKGPPETADPVDVAALLWLARPDGWERALAHAVRRVEQRRDDVVLERGRAELERAARRVAEVEEELRESHARHREQVERLKADNAVLRRRLGEARAAEREARTALAGAGARSDREMAAGTAALAAAEAEGRRLRAQVEELRATAAQARGQARSQVRQERDEVSTRARILLDTVIEAAAGLRRELALPAVGETPGLRAEAELAARDPTAGAEVVPASAGPVSPAVLEQLLARPRSRLVVDGYNVTKTAYPSSTLEAQRARLVRSLAALVARTGAETTVVFDAAASTHRPVVPGPRGVRVVWSPPGVLADDVIRRLVEAEPAGRPTVVVTSDQEVRRDVARAGVRVVDSSVLAAALR